MLLTNINDHTQELEHLLNEGFVTLRSHPEFPLKIYNYTAKAQYSPKEVWTPLLKQLRGLIVNEKGEVIARPFQKFFNLEEVKDSPEFLEACQDQDYKVYEKLDGSLGVGFWYNGRYWMATR